MQISSKYVGVECKPLEVEVALRHCMNYAAAIGDDNPWHLDDTRPEGVIAPPMLAIVLTWRISEHFFEYWGGADFPYEAIARQVHFSEAIEWKRPMRPGERLRIEGRVSGILPHRAGTHLILSYTAYDARDEVVFIEHIGGLLRGVKCADDGQGGDALETYGTPSEDACLWEKTLHISKFAPHIYDGCADVHFPIHISPAFAKSVGLPGIIFQGTGTLAMALSAITKNEAENDPRRIRAAQCRFTGMVKPDSDILLKVTGQEPREGGCVCRFVVLNEQGKQALSEGSVTIGPAEAHLDTR